jgi:hypothetical protein
MAEFRCSYCQPISTGLLVKCGIPRLAGGHALVVVWGFRLIDQGFRGEMECIIAKIIDSDREAGGLTPDPCRA